MINYKQKYNKYKTKYLNSKNVQQGGVYNFTDIIYRYAVNNKEFFYIPEDNPEDFKSKILEYEKGKIHNWVENVKRDLNNVIWNDKETWIFQETYVFKTAIEEKYEIIINRPTEIIKPPEEIIKPPEEIIQHPPIQTNKELVIRHTPFKERLEQKSPAPSIQTSPPPPIQPTIKLIIPFSIQTSALRSYLERMITRMKKKIKSVRKKEIVSRIISHEKTACDNQIKTVKDSAERMEKDYCNFIEKLLRNSKIYIKPICYVMRSNLRTQWSAFEYLNTFKPPECGTQIYGWLVNFKNRTKVMALLADSLKDKYARVLIISPVVENMYDLMFKSKDNGDLVRKIYSTIGTYDKDKQNEQRMNLLCPEVGECTHGIYYEPNVLKIAHLGGLMPANNINNDEINFVGNGYLFGFHLEIRDVPSDRLQNSLFEPTTRQIENLAIDFFVNNLDAKIHIINKMNLFNNYSIGELNHLFNSSNIYNICNTPDK
jgi:hypothetical protein